jgi:hypothetical protein
MSTLTSAAQTLLSHLRWPHTRRCAHTSIITYVDYHLRRLSLTSMLSFVCRTKLAPPSWVHTCIHLDSFFKWASNLLTLGKIVAFWFWNFCSFLHNSFQRWNFYQTVPELEKVWRKILSDSFNCLLLLSYLQNKTFFENSSEKAFKN